MAKDIAALSGGDQNILRGALASMGYMVPVAAPTVVSSPVAYVDLVLPADYVEFSLRVVGLRSNAAIAFLFSQDNGATWLTDAGGDEETYQYRLPDDTGNVAAVGYLAAASVDSATGRSVSLLTNIVPGAADEFAYALTWGTQVNGSGIPLIDRGTMTCLHIDLGRVNKIRILASDQWVYDNDDASRLSAGTFAVFGIS